MTEHTDAAADWRDHVYAVAVQVTGDQMSAHEIARRLTAPQPGADPVTLNAMRAALDAVDSGRAQIARDNLRILEIHLRAQAANSSQPGAAVPEGMSLLVEALEGAMIESLHGEGFDLWAKNRGKLRNRLPENVGAIVVKMRALLAAAPAPESLRDWSERMAAVETGQHVSAGSHGIADEPAPDHIADAVEMVPEAAPKECPDCGADDHDGACEPQLFDGAPEAERAKGKNLAPVPYDQHEREVCEVIEARDQCEEVIDNLLDMVLGPDRPEWSSAYGYGDALLDVADKMAAHPAPESHADCCDTPAYCSSVRRCTAHDEKKPSPEAHGGEAEKQADDDARLWAMFRALVNAGGPDTIAVHGVQRGRDAWAGAVRRGMMVIEKRFFPERFAGDVFPTGSYHAPPAAGQAEGVEALSIDDLAMEWLEKARDVERKTSAEDQRIANWPIAYAVMMTLKTCAADLRRLDSLPMGGE